MAAVALTTVEACRAMRSRVVAAIVEGEPVEELLGAAVAADPGGSGTDASSGIDRRIRDARLAARRLATRWIGRRRTPAGQVEKLRRVIEPFRSQLEALPTRIDVAQVGDVVVVAPATIEAMPAWVARIEDGNGLLDVYHEVRRAMADLTGARMRLELGCARLPG